MGCREAPGYPRKGKWMIYIDKRVGSGELKRYFPLAYKTRLIEMPAADFKFRGLGPGDVKLWVGIERKALGDMLQSMRDGRLAGFQLPKMMAAFKYRFIIIEGSYQIDKDGFIAVWRRKKGLVPFKLGEDTQQYFRYAELDKFCQTITQLSGTVILRSNSKQETAAIVCNRYDWFQKRWKEHKSLQVGYEPPPPPRRLMRPGVVAQWAAKLYSIKWVLAARVEEEFDTVFEMVNAPVERWEKVKGIGKLKAAQAYAELRGEKVRVRR